MAATQSPLKQVSFVLGTLAAGKKAAVADDSGLNASSDISFQPPIDDPATWTIVDSQISISNKLNSDGNEVSKSMGVGEGGARGATAPPLL